MPIFITRGRFTAQAISGMLSHPEDRKDSIAKLFEASGGRLISYYMTFGEYDFLVISEGPFEGTAVSVIAAAAGGGVTELNTTLAMTSSDMKDAFTKAAPVAAGFKSAGAQARTQ